VRRYQEPILLTAKTKENLMSIPIYRGMRDSERRMPTGRSISEGKGPKVGFRSSIGFSLLGSLIVVTDDLIV
jgi:hypothetical protein